MYRVVFTPECRADLLELRSYIARHTSARVAANYMARLKTFCQELAAAPERGEHRPGIPFHQRTIGFERRVSVIFAVRPTDERVIIVGIRYGGRALV